jgi:hypothetical protein
VNGLLDAKSRRPLPYLQVMPAGKTNRSRCNGSALQSSAGGPTFASNSTTRSILWKSTPERIRVEPAVGKMKLLASGDQIQITGDFDLKQRYKVSISPN